MVILFLFALEIVNHRLSHQRDDLPAGQPVREAESKRVRTIASHRGHMQRGSSPRGRMPVRATLPALRRARPTGPFDNPENVDHLIKLLDERANEPEK